MAAETLHISFNAEPIFHIGSVVISNSILVSWGVVLFLLAITWWVRRSKFALVPNGIQNFFELVVEGTLNFIDQITGDRELTKRFFPLTFTIFLFVILANWSGLIPGMSLLTYEHHHLFRAPSADLNFTVALALVSVVACQFFGFSALGVVKHLKKYFSLHPVKGFVGILEIVSEVAKVISFSFRLFGNVFAGEILLMVIAFLVPYLVPLPFLALEVFVGFVQALVFAMLTLVFARLAVEAHDDHH